jgi:3-hydroxyacyl-CoA dehydrogenase / enoyl-CoA hydratase / 3-hydroxybutyryl-CoA epimerase
MAGKKKTTRKNSGAASANPSAKGASAQATSPADGVSPVEDVSSVEGASPVEDMSPVEGTSPVEGVSAVDASPADVTADEATDEAASDEPLPEIELDPALDEGWDAELSSGNAGAPVDEPAPAAKAAPVAKPAPAAKAAPVERPAPAAKPAPVEKPAPAAKAAPVEKPAPAAKAAPVEKPAPAAKAAPVERPAPAAKPAPAAPVEVSAPTASPLLLTVRPDGVAVVTFDVPGESQNTLRADFVDAFEAVIDALERDQAVRGVVLISGKPDTFIAGADIGMLKAVKAASDAEALARRGQAAMQRLNDLPVPVVAAINGPCLGGGLELALACHSRVCTDNAKTQLALPEVQLGLLPGSGGTQRLPRLVGVAAALDMMLTGRRIFPKRALRMGLVDEVVPASILLDAAAQRAIKLSASLPGATRKASLLSSLNPQKLQQLLLEENAVGRLVLFQQARKQLFKKTLGNYPAPERIIDAVEASFLPEPDAGYALEARAFGQLVVSPEARSLMQIFFATTALKKDTGVAADLPVQPPLRRVGVLGAGLMGSGIAVVTADRCGLPVRIKDRDNASVARGLGEVQKYFEGRAKRRILSRPDAQQRAALVSGTTDLSGFSRCDVVIEAVFEDLALKHKMLKDIEASCPQGVIFATNTSSIPIARIAAAAERPENVIGMHYFSPVEKMPLLEVIVTSQTSDAVTARCVALGKAQGKTVIVVRDGVGFYTSRILAPYMNEAAQILSEGVSVESIDRALKQWGFPVGPITLLDEVGIDVAAKVGPIMVAAFGDRMTPPPAFQKLIDDQRMGRKNKRGFYDYSGKSKKKAVDASVYEVLGISPTLRLDATAIAERCAFQMINEAILCLQEGILRSPRDGDIGAIFGLGFPPFRGGPFRYVDALGPAEALRRLERFATQYGPRFTPAQMLVDLVRQGRRFHDAP